jgi:magnesium-transporting ATPase (P-type)
LIKKILLRGLGGILPVIAVGYLITIVISLLFLDGQYNPVVPALSAQFEHEIYAVLVQTAFLALIGFVQGAVSVVWDMDELSYMKQTGICFFVYSLIVLPVAYFMRWMPRSPLGFAAFFGLFTLAFFITWLIQYCIWRAKIRKINEKLDKRK